MAILLRKGQSLSLDESKHNLSEVKIGLGWDIIKPKKGFYHGLFEDKTAEYDLDVVALMCNEQGKIKNLGWDARGKPTFRNSDVIFFDNLSHSTGQVWLTGDNRTGAGDGDDEQIIVKLNTLSEEYHRIVFIVQIYDGIKNQQDFGQVQNAFIRAVDGSGNEMVRFDLSGSDEYEEQRSLVFAELVREIDGWRFSAIGNPSPSDNFMEWIKQYV